EPAAARVPWEVPYPDLGVVVAHDVRTVPVAIEPSFHHLVGRAVTVGDVLAGGAPFVAGVRHALRWGDAIGIVMREEVTLVHVEGVQARGTGERSVHGQRRGRLEAAGTATTARRGPGLVDQQQHLLLPLHPHRVPIGARGAVVGHGWVDGGLLLRLDVRGFGRFHV